MVDKECNLRAGVYKVQTFGTTHRISQIYKPEMTSIPYGHNEHSLLRHHIRPRFHDRPYHHENHARLLVLRGRNKPIF